MSSQIKCKLFISIFNKTYLQIIAKKGKWECILELKKKCCELSKVTIRTGLDVESLNSCWHKNTFNF